MTNHKELVDKLNAKVKKAHDEDAKNVGKFHICLIESVFTNSVSFLDYIFGFANEHADQHKLANLLEGDTKTEVKPKEEAIQMLKLSVLQLAIQLTQLESIPELEIFIERISNELCQD
jgi:hypothetical protein